MNMWLLLMACALSEAGPDRPTDTAGIVYSPQRAFRIPLELSVEERAQLKAIRVYVSQDAGQTWVRHSDGPADLKVVTFRAKEDGDYWFTIALVDAQDKQSPPDVREVEPGLKVAVDTERPSLMVKAIRSKSGRRGVRWTVDDRHPSAGSICLAVWNKERSAWDPFEIRHPEKGMVWFDDGAAIERFQAMATDQAGNETVVEVEVVGEQFSKRDVEQFALRAGAPASATAPIVDSSKNPAPPSTIQQTSHSVSEPTPVEVTVCASRDVVVNYTVDGATDAKAQLWATKDNGREWKLVATDEDRKSPVEAQLESDGVWGLKLVVASQGEPSAPPAPGALPEMSIEVDTSEPLVENVRGVLQDGDIYVSYTASDKNLDDQSIDVLVGSSPSGPWKTVAKGLKNTGAYSFSPRSAPGGKPFWIRVEARDRAQHVGAGATAEPVELSGAGADPAHRESNAP